MRRERRFYRQNLSAVSITSLPRSTVPITGWSVLKSSSSSHFYAASDGSLLLRDTAKQGSGQVNFGCLEDRHQVVFLKL
ncbi:hypothetical protein ABRP91_02790 [Pectobacterium brasiliense]|uniref:hypothetical protein n=1 Tax=Pectobacterium brasiliense TaxID=180957 RepID=UPI0032EBBF0B